MLYSDLLFFHIINFNKVVRMVSEFCLPETGDAEIRFTVDVTGFIEEYFMA